MRWKVGIVLVVVACLALWYFASSRGMPVQTAAVEQKTIRAFIDERGITRLPNEYEITMPYAARILPITLQEGDPVSRGQVVAQVVPSDLENELAEAQAEVERLTAAIEKNMDTSVEGNLREQAALFVESMVSTVAAAEARKLAGESRVEYAEKVLDRVRTLNDQGSESQQALDRAELDRVESQVDFRQDVLVAESLKAIQAATALLPKMVGDYIARKALETTVLEKQRNESQARLRAAQVRQERGTMLSPIDGIVLQRDVTNEQYLEAGAVLMRIGRLEQLEVEVEVLSEDVVEIQPGDPVEIYGPALGAAPGEGVPGLVDRIYPRAFTKLSSLGVERQRVLVIVRFADGVLPALRQERELGVQYRIRARIFTARSDDALTIPRPALFRGPDGGWQVYAIRDGRAQLVDVQTGIMNDDRVEIVGGLQKGEAVVLAPEVELENGMRVEPVSTP